MPARRQAGVGQRGRGGWFGADGWRHVGCARGWEAEGARTNGSNGCAKMTGMPPDSVRVSVDTALQRRRWRVSSQTLVDPHCE
mmetsp:Transcript_51161/g.104075  ORF Transcript_51161/g.104075 Transcript_51161/m.104075 type:complete len:83 (+) Transcript_51161:409-657(+)